MMKINSLLLIIIGFFPTAIFAQHPCTRSAAQPVIKKAAYPNATFRLNSDSLTATENVRLKKGDHLTVKNNGCEYYVLTFHFKTPRFRHDTTDVPFWYRKSIRMMKNLVPALDAPLNLSAGIDQLQQYVRQSQPLHFNKRLNYSSKEIPDFVTLDSVKKINKKYIISITFATGPL